MTETPAGALSFNFYIL